MSSVQTLVQGVSIAAIYDGSVRSRAQDKANRGKRNLAPTRDERLARCSGTDAENAPALALDGLFIGRYRWNA